VYTSKHYLLGRAIALFVGGIIFTIGSIILPMINDNFKVGEMLFITIFIGPAMSLFDLIYYGHYKIEVASELKLYEENKRLKKEIANLKSNKRRDV
jgi:hypothetical protein